MAKVMTFGVLPAFEEFARAFETECPDGLFTIRNCERVGTSSYTVIGLWAEVRVAINEWQDGEEYSEAAGDWASRVLTVLGFEWV